MTGMIERGLRVALLAMSAALLASAPAASQARAGDPLQAAGPAERAFHRRAVEAALWGMPIVNFDAMRQAYFRDAGAQYNDMLYWSKPADWKYQVTTPNNSINYVMFFLNLKQGPVVVEVPATGAAALFGSLLDAWNVPLADVGDNGEDKGKGGKYVLLPPGSQASPEGYIPVRSSTFNVYSLLRVIPKSARAEDWSRALAFLKQLKIYPLSSADAPRPSRLIDMVDKPYEAIPPYDAGFYASLARMIAEEPAKERDLTMLAQLRSIGIGKELKFQPDAARSRLLESAIAEAHAYMVEGFKNDGLPWWPQRHWRTAAKPEAVQSRFTFILGDRLLLDERAFLFYAAFAPPRNRVPNLYVKSFEDGKGNALDGAHDYRLRIPANVPTTQFWSVNVYDRETAGFIRAAPVVGLDSYDSNLKKNADGSVDLYFSAKAPQGREANWIPTAKGKPFFVFFRNYAPAESVMTRTSTWVLDDLERID